MSNAGDLEPREDRDAFSQTQLSEQELYADRVDGAKASYDATSERWEFFDLIEDPGETQNLAARETERLTRISYKLEPYVAYAGRV